MMSDAEATFRIVTDHKWKRFRSMCEIPSRTLDTDFDWLNKEFDGSEFILYRKRWYHISEFMRSEKMIPEWHGYLADSMFSGVVIRISDDGENYMVGTFLS
jgi:hypothetical protein